MDMKYLLHIELENNDERYAEIVALLDKLGVFWSEEEVDENGFQV